MFSLHYSTTTLVTLNIYQYTSHNFSRITLKFSGLPDISRNEQRDTRAESIALLQQLVEADNNNSSEKELDNDEDSIAGTEIADVSVHAGQHICDCLTDSDQDTEELLGTITTQFPKGRSNQ